jgi:lysophospholipase L1-like esterase
MDRRSALSLLALGALGACGGGGAASADIAVGASGTVPGPGSQTPDPAQPAAPAQPAPQALSVNSPNIACWGDSLTDLYWDNLQRLYTDRRVFNGGVVGETSIAIDARVQADTAHRDWISVFWYGHNNFTKEHVATDIANSIARLAPNNKAFIVLSMLNWANQDERGTASYNDIMRVNGELASRYPDNFIDIHGYLVSLFQPDNVLDILDHNNDLVPRSLRFDTIHLNDTGCNAVAAKIRDFIAAKRW